MTNDSFCGFIDLNGSILISALTRDTTNALKDAAALPTFRVYGPAGLMNGGTGTAAFQDTGVITGATNVNPIVVTSAGHGLSSGTRLTIANVLGNTNANGDFTITVIDPNTFSIPIAGNGPYVSGGTWHATGLYKITVAATDGNGYLAGQTYTIKVDYTVGGTPQADVYRFTVS